MWKDKCIHCFRLRSIAIIYSARNFTDCPSAPICFKLYMSRFIITPPRLWVEKRKTRASRYTHDNSCCPSILSKSQRLWAPMLKYLFTAVPTSHKVFTEFLLRKNRCNSRKGLNPLWVLTDPDLACRYRSGELALVDGIECEIYWPAVQPCCMLHSMPNKFLRVERLQGLW